MAWSRDPNRYRGVPAAQANRIRKRDRGTCQKCRAPGHEVDHKRNVRSGGTDDDTNLWVLCARCHKAKTESEANEANAAKRAKLKLPKSKHPGLL